MLPRNNEAQELLISKLPNLRRDLASRFSYSFGGKFEQIGGTGDGSSGGGGTCEEIQRIDKNTIDKLFD